MLKSIRLKNFKLHEDTSIEAAPITVFIGPNNSGKSSIFQALLLWWQARGGQEYVPGDSKNVRHGDDVVDVGEFGDVVRRGEKEIRLKLEGKVAPPKAAKTAQAVETSFEAVIHDNKLIYHDGVFKNPLATFKWT